MHICMYVYVLHTYIGQCITMCIYIYVCICIYGYTNVYTVVFTDDKVP